MGARSLRFKEMMLSSLLLVWEPSTEHRSRFAMSTLLPVAIAIIITAVVYIITESVKDMVANDSGQGGELDGEWPAVVVSSMSLDHICFDDNGNPLFETCLGIVNDSENANYDMIIDNIRTDIAGNREDQYRFFDSVEEAEEKVLKWVGFESVDCERCSLPDTFGYFLIFSKNVMGIPYWQVATRDPDSINQLDREKTPYSKLSYLGENGSGEYALLAYIYKSLGNMEIESGRVPDITPTSLSYPTEVSSGSLASKTSQEYQESTSVSSFSFTTVMLVPLLIASLSLSNVFSFECSITRSVLQAGMHQLPILLAGCTYLLYFAIIFIILSFILWGLFPSTFGSIYANDNFTFGTGFSLYLINVFGFLIQAATIMAAVPNRILAIVIVLILELFGIGIMTGLQMQGYSWPYILISVIIPSTAGTMFAQNINVFKTMAIQSSQFTGILAPEIVIDSSWKFNIYNTYTSDYPDKYLSPIVTQVLSKQYMSQFESLPWMYLGAILSILVHIILLYIGYSIKPREIGGSFHPSHIFLTIPKCKKLHENVRKNFQNEENHDTNNSTSQDVSQENDSYNDVALRTKNLSKYYKVLKGTSKKQMKNSDRYIKTKVRGCRNKKRYMFAAVDDVTINFKSHEITGLLGINGAGKSTLMRLLMGLTKPTSGSMEMLGESILTKKSNILDILPLVGYVPQHNILGNFSCSIHCCIMAALRGVPGGIKAWRNEAEIALNKVGLGKDGDDKIFASAKTLSGGQKRRLMIAMALSGHPPLLILDEPSAGLSLDAKIVLNDTLQKIKEESRDESIIITEHDLEQIDELCDKLVIMRDGKAVAQGTSLTLKEEYGSGFTLRVAFEEVVHFLNNKENIECDMSKSLDDSCSSKGNEVSDNENNKDMEDMVNLNFEDCRPSSVKKRTEILLNLLKIYDANAEIKFMSGRDVFFKLTDQAKNDIGNIHKSMKKNKHNLGIRSYSVDITTLSDVFINISENRIKDIEEGSDDDGNNEKSEEGDLSKSTSDMKPPIVSEHKIISYNKSFKSLSRKTHKSFWKSLQVVLKFIGDAALCIVLMSLFTKFSPDLMDFLNTSTSAISLENKSGYEMNNYASSVLSKVRWTYNSVSISDEQYNEITSIMSAIATTESIEFLYDDLQTELYKDRQREIISGTILDSYAGDLSDYIGTPIIVWETDNRISVYLPPEYYIETFERNISDIDILDPTIIGIIIDRAKQGYTTGDRNSLLFSEQQISTTEPLRSFYGDPRSFVLPLISVFIPFYATLICITLTSMAIVIPYLLTRERVTGFFMLLRLAGERRFSNILSWLVCIQIPCMIISIILTTLGEILPLENMKNTGEASEIDWNRISVFIIVVAVSCIPFCMIWTLLGIWVSYRYKSAERALKVAPLLICLLLIPLIIIMSVMSLATSNMTFAEIRNLWNVLEWVFGIIPISLVPTFVIDLYFYSLLPSIYTLDLDILIPCLFVNILFMALFLVIVFIREGIECGYIKSPPFSRCFSHFVTFGKHSANDIPEPSKKIRALLNCPRNTDVVLPEDKHPKEDETVELERQKVHGNDSLKEKAVIVFSRCRREFNFPDKGKNKKILVAVRNLDLLVNPGECLGLVGENGAGKTTALSMAIGLLSPSFGSASIKSRKLGYVPQFDAHCSCITVMEHINLFADLSGILREKAREIAYFVGMKQHMKKYPNQLSGGYKRRLSLALALITSSELLVADEVAAGVDERARCDIIGMIDSLKEAGCTIIITSHNMETVDRVTTRVAMFTKGFLRTIDTPDSLKQRYSSGITIIMQLAPNSVEKAREWLAEKTDIEAKNIVSLPSLGGDCRFMIPRSKDTNIMKIFDILKPDTRPEWVLRASASESSLESVFLSFEKETKELGLNNIVDINTYKEEES